MAIDRSNHTDGICCKGHVSCRITCGMLMGLPSSCCLLYTSSPIRPVAVARKGAGHDGGIGEDGFASASFLRARWEDGLEAVLPYLPQQVHGVYKQARAEGRVLDRERWQWMELSGLRTLSIEAFAQGPDLSLIHI